MTTAMLRMQHTSLEFSDTPTHQEHDIHALFDKGGGYPIKSGTEAGVTKEGPNTNHELLVEYADAYDHIINFAADSWVAVDRSIIVPGSAVKEDVFLASNDMFREKVHGADRILATLSFEHTKPGLGTVHVGSVHYPTKGATKDDPNYRVNQLCAEKIANWLAKHGAGPDLAFVNGDFNMPDRTLDFSLGRNFTSMADELKAWQNTGHGPIDGMCSFDRDGRTKSHRFTVLDDSEFHLYTDHFMCRGAWEILLRKVTS